MNSLQNKILLNTLVHVQIGQGLISDGNGKKYIVVTWNILLSFLLIILMHFSTQTQCYLMTIFLNESVSLASLKVLKLIKSFDNYLSEEVVQMQVKCNPFRSYWKLLNRQNRERKKTNHSDITITAHYVILLPFELKVRMSDNNSRCVSF